MPTPPETLHRKRNETVQYCSQANDGLRPFCRQHFELRDSRFACALACSEHKKPGTNGRAPFRCVVKPRLNRTAALAGAISPVSSRRSMSDLEASFAT